MVAIRDRQMEEARLKILPFVPKVTENERGYQVGIPPPEVLSTLRVCTQNEQLMYTLLALECSHSPMLVRSFV